jgi:hypothetical protein
LLPKKFYLRVHPEDGNRPSIRNVGLSINWHETTVLNTVPYYGEENLNPPMEAH